jgi:uncharacterized protein YukJ
VAVLTQIKVKYFHLGDKNMALKYGVLKGVVTGHLRDADDDHYQILVKAGTGIHRIASNVKSSAPNSPSTVFFQTTTTLPDSFKKGLTELAAGFSKLKSESNGLAIDYVRGGLVKVKTMKLLPPDAPGVDNDLKDLLETAIVKAMDLEGSTIYAFGAKWGPEPGKADKYFRFVPGNGIHDIHMNQGNSGKYKKDNGIYQDGALVISYPDDKWRAFFFAFQSQDFETDESGNSIHDVASKKPSSKSKGTSKGGIRKKSALKPHKPSKSAKKSKKENTR